jgi:hypothetical protein
MCSKGSRSVWGDLRAGIVARVSIRTVIGSLSDKCNDYFDGRKMTVISSTRADGKEEIRRSDDETIR